MRKLNPTWALVALSLLVGCKDRGAAEGGTSAQDLGAELEGTCTSTLHERSPFDTEYEFDLDCAVTYFQDAGCDFTLDPDGDGEKIASSTIEDMANDPAACIRGNACTGCDDEDNRDDGLDCDEIAAYSHFGPTAAAALLTYVGDDETCGAPDLLIEGVPLTEAEATAILTVANGASQTQLDDDAGLDARAAVNIVDGRPIPDMDSLAAVSYVGQKAIEALRDYAGNWTPPDEDEEDEEDEEEEPEADPAEGCDTLTVTAGVNADATDLARLIELATMGDFPAFVVPPLQASGCAAFMDDPANQEAMMWAIWGQIYPWDRGDLPDSMIENGSWTAGGSDFLSLLNTSLVVIEEHIADGDWDPDADAEGAALYARREALVEALSADALANPANYVEIRMDIEAVECSQEAVALLKLDDLSIVAINWLPRC